MSPSQQFSQEIKLDTTVPKASTKIQPETTQLLNSLAKFSQLLR